MPAIIDQILAQSQAGSANGAIIPGFAEGAKLAMERRKLDSDLQTEELQRSTMAEMAAFNRQMQVLKLQEARTNMQKLVGLQQANTDASKLVAWAVQEPSVLDTPEFQSHAAGVLGNPLVMSTDNGKTLFGMLNSRNDHKAALAANLKPGMRVVKNPDGSSSYYYPEVDAATLADPNVTRIDPKTGQPIALNRPRAGADGNPATLVEEMHTAPDGSWTWGMRNTKSGAFHSVAKGGPGSPANLAEFKSVLSGINRVNSQLAQLSSNSNLTEDQRAPALRTLRMQKEGLELTLKQMKSGWTPEQGGQPPEDPELSNLFNDTQTGVPETAPATAPAAPPAPPAVPVQMLIPPGHTNQVPVALPTSLQEKQALKPGSYYKNPKDGRIYIKN